MEGFFSSAELPVVTNTLIGSAKCGACGIYKSCQSPKIPVTGRGRQRILIVGSAPGRDGDQRNAHMVEDVELPLKQALRKHGIDPAEDCWFTNALICRPPKDRAPTSSEVGYCRPNLINTIKKLKPAVIILMGDAAIQSCLAYTWAGHDIGTTSRWVGWQIPDQKINAYLCPTWHPSYLLKMNDAVLDAQFETNVKDAITVAKKGPPWGEGHVLPEQTIKLIYDDHEIDATISRIIRASKPVAFDYETNMLKPDSKDSRIVCCSISNGKVSVAFPWSDRAQGSMRRLLQAGIPLYGYNSKFESRWSYRHMKVWPRVWVHDGMVAAHILDNRPGITSLKFQSYVHFGQPDYDSRIKPYLSGEGGNGPNNIYRVDTESLLTYCAMDSLLEYRIAVRQMEAINGLRRKAKG